MKLKLPKFIKICYHTKVSFLKEEHFKMSQIKPIDIET